VITARPLEPLSRCDLGAMEAEVADIARSLTRDVVLVLDEPD